MGIEESIKNVPESFRPEAQELAKMLERNSVAHSIFITQDQYNTDMVEFDKRISQAQAMKRGKQIPIQLYSATEKLNALKLLWQASNEGRRSEMITRAEFAKEMRALLGLKKRRQVRKTTSRSNP